jgi:hypothetical protein
MIAGTAHAGTAPGLKELSFRYAEHKRASRESVATLHQRAREFARRECATGVIYLVPAETKCRRDLEAQLIRKIGDGRLARAAKVRLDRG